MSVYVVMPTRGRVHAAKATIESFRDTASRFDTKMIVAVDRNDPQLDSYRTMVHGFDHGGTNSKPLWPSDGAYLMVLDDDETGDLVRATNSAVRRLPLEKDDIVANIGDDHRFRTDTWDYYIEQALEEPGIAYGDDLLQSENLPTAPFISAPIIEALGWYALPTLRHMYIDNVWKDIGEGIGRLKYLPHVVIEHVHPMHPKGPKAKMDAQYASYNSDEFKFEESSRYGAWLISQADRDIQNVRSYLEDR